jgi:hypothetical protein
MGGPVSEIILTQAALNTEMPAVGSYYESKERFVRLITSPLFDDERDSVSFVLRIENASDDGPNPSVYGIKPVEPLQHARVNDGIADRRHAAGKICRRIFLLGIFDGPSPSARQDAN